MSRLLRSGRVRQAVTVTRPTPCESIRAASTVADIGNAKVIFSGIQPTGIPHLGNYLGALQQWVKLQETAEDSTKLFFSIVDLHAVTVTQDAERLRRCRREMFAALIAVGLNPNRSTIFFQSSVPAHSELMWLLSCQASMGYLSRMTQWKTKLNVAEDTNPLKPSSNTQLKLGLFSYPVLQAADILVHRATHVPVGHDQSQHLEFARECANGFNHLHGQVLVQPETILSPAKRVMALDKPMQKMSKSHLNPNSRILLTDSTDVISKKIRAALTDSTEGISYDPELRPGVSNLLDIAFHLNPSDAKSPSELAETFRDSSIQALKGEVTSVVDKHLAPIRDRYCSILDSQSHLIEDYAASGAQSASKNASTTMLAVRDAMGL